jgi:hypothetical protein
MAGYCRNMYESVYVIKEWYKSVHRVGYFYYVNQHTTIVAQQQEHNFGLIYAARRILSVKFRPA